MYQPLDYLFPKPPIAHLIGHRGLPSKAPENSLESFKLAIEAGLNWIEFDVQVTKDHQLIIMHDDTIDRTTTSTGIVYELTFEQLRKIKLKPSNLTIPTLAETMALLNQYHIHANIELKLPENLSEMPLSLIRINLFNAFTHYLQQHYPEAENNPIAWPFVSSFDHEILIQLRKLYPSLPLGFLVEKPENHHLDLAYSFMPASLNCDSRYVTKNFMELAKNQHIPILVYTVNNIDVAQTLIDYGVYGLFTDFGDTLKAALTRG